MNLFELAQRFVGEIRELPGSQQHPFIQWAHMLCNLGADSPDEVPWCSSFLNAVCWQLRLPRSKSARARSWLSVGRVVLLPDIVLGDVVIFNRGGSPDPLVLSGPGHVGLYAGGGAAGRLQVLGGNQSDGVTVASFASSDVLGVRRLT